MSNTARTLLTVPKFRVVEHELFIRPGEEPIRRQVVEHPGAVAIVPMLPGNHVCLIRNYRIAVGKTLIELPAGTIAPQEDPSVTAARELQEETGFIAQTWRRLPNFYMSPGILNERMHLFVAEGLNEGLPAREAGEEIENLIVPWQQAVQMAQEGQIEDAKSLVGIFLWEHLRQST